MGSVGWEFRDIIFRYCHKIHDLFVTVPRGHLQKRTAPSTAITVNKLEVSFGRKIEIIFYQERIKRLFNILDIFVLLGIKPCVGLEKVPLMQSLRPHQLS